MSRAIIVGLVLVLCAAGSSSPVLADAPLKANPPIQEVIIGAVEPVPTGVFRMLQYNVYGNTGEYDTAALPDGLFWRIEPENVIPFRSVDAKAVACGFSATPSATITLPSQKVLTVKAIERLSADQWNYTLGENGRDPKRVLCWSYALSYGYGIELGTYAITVTGKEGALTGTWQAEYPVHTGDRNVLTGKIAEGAYFLGYEPKTTFQILYYKWLKTTKRAGSFVAARTITADEHGVAIVKTRIKHDAPFKISDLFIVIEDPFHVREYQVVGDPLPNPQINRLWELGTIEAPFDIDQYRSIWQGITFKNSKQPEIVEYRQTVKSDDEILFNFKWCADSDVLLETARNSIHVNFFINDNVIPNEEIGGYKKGRCFQWATVLRAWEPKSQVTLELQYTLNKPINDGKTVYLPGTYIHRILVSVS